MHRIAPSLKKEIGSSIIKNRFENQFLEVTFFLIT